jgi:type II secretory pathway pseudopilin PulG
MGGRFSRSNTSALLQPLHRQVAADEPISEYRENAAGTPTGACGASVAPCVGMSRAPVRSPAGFSLVEALVAIAVMLVAVTSLSQLFGIAAAANQRATRRTFAAVLARQKMEQLRSLPLGSDASPPGALLMNIDGFSDVVTGGGSQPSLARWWSIEPLPSDPTHLLVLDVLVLDPQGGVEVHLTSLRQRGSA